MMKSFVPFLSLLSPLCPYCPHLVPTLSLFVPHFVPSAPILSRGHPSWTKKMAVGIKISGVPGMLAKIKENLYAL